MMINSLTVDMDVSYYTAGWNPASGIVTELFGYFSPNKPGCPRKSLVPGICTCSAGCRQTMQLQLYIHNQFIAGLTQLR